MIKLIFVILNLGFNLVRRHYCNAMMESLSLFFASFNLGLLLIVIFYKLDISTRYSYYSALMIFILCSVSLKLSLNLVDHHLNKLLSKDFLGFKNGEDFFVVFDYLFSNRSIFDKKYKELDFKNRKEFMKIRTFLIIHRKNHATCKTNKKLHVNKYEHLMNEILENGIKKNPNSTKMLYQYLFFNTNSLSKYPGYTYLKIKKNLIIRKLDEDSLTYKFLVKTIENILEKRYIRKSLEIEGDPWYRLDFDEKMVYLQEKMVRIKEHIESFYSSYSKSTFSFMEIWKILFKIANKKEKIERQFETLQNKYDHSSHLLSLRINYLLYLDNFESKANMLMKKYYYTNDRKGELDEHWRIGNNRKLDSEESKACYLNYSPTSGVIVISGEKQKMATIEDITENVVKLLGYSKEELKSSPIEILMPKSMQEYHEKRIRHCIEVGRFTIFGLLSEYFVIDKEGFVIPIFHVAKYNPCLNRGLTFLGLIDKNPTPNEYILTNEEGEIVGMTRAISKFLYKRKIDNRRKEAISVFKHCPKLKKVYEEYNEKDKVPRLKKKESYLGSSLINIENVVDIENRFEEICLPFIRFGENSSTELSLFSNQEQNEKNRLVYLKFRLRSYISIFGVELYRYLEFKPNYDQSEDITEKINERREDIFSIESFNFDEGIQSVDKLKFNYLTDDHRPKLKLEKSIESSVVPKETFRNSDKSLILKTSSISDDQSEKEDLQGNELGNNLSSKLSIQNYKRKKKIEDNLRKPFFSFKARNQIITILIHLSISIFLSVYCKFKITEVFDKQIKIYQGSDRYLRMNTLNSASMLSSRNLDLMGRGLHDRNIKVSDKNTIESITKYGITLYNYHYERFLRDSLKSMESSSEEIRNRLIAIRFNVPEPSNIKATYNRVLLL